eukprot:1491112-Rhodomonas_salina.1
MEWLPAILLLWRSLVSAHKGTFRAEHIGAGTLRKGVWYLQAQHRCAVPRNAIFCLDLQMVG